MTEEVHTTEKTIFEKIGGEFERQGDYLIPRLTLPPEKEQPIGLFGWQHLDYLKQHRKFTYTNLLTSVFLDEFIPEEQPKIYIHKSSYKRQAQRLSCRHRQAGAGTY